MTAVTEGFTTAPRAASARAAARRGRWGIVVIVLIAVLVAVVVATTRAPDSTPMSTTGTTPAGARAVAQVLRDQGVDVRQVAWLADARIASPETTTLVLVDPSTLGPAQVASIARYPGDVVLLGSVGSVAPALGLAVEDVPVPVAGLARPACADPDAQAAGQVRVQGWGLRAVDDAAVDDAPLTCFALADGAAAFARAEADGRTVTAIASADLVTNGELDQLGHAALALRTLGRHPQVVWYLGDIFDDTTLTTGDSGAAAIEARPDFLPPGTGSALYALALAVGVVALWRGRRFGALVREPLPVVVRASEATRGRARLYRSIGARGRATAALRGTAALRMGRRLGVARGSGRDALVAAIHRATGRPAGEVAALLYGPVPPTDAQMMTLVAQIDALEKEVHRP
ncbi:DUF4350 domain-containing protein [Demequina pelophila]|uniref:DUF4350 domain-containing protein n=1 Tax=Demequina pelophila TaxID=1638984 RepID=UPI0007847FAC|nr:DUF4350 domain-containing protein [Demequina pelophila]